MREEAKQNQSANANFQTLPPQQVRHTMSQASVKMVTQTWWPSDAVKNAATTWDGSCDRTYGATNPRHAHKTAEHDHECKFALG